VEPGSQGNTSQALTTSWSVGCFHADDMARPRCSCGLIPRTRLNAALSANGLLYPTFRATA
jgi:hypothetical protein